MTSLTVQFTQCCFITDRIISMSRHASIRSCDISQTAPPINRIDIELENRSAIAISRPDAPSSLGAMSSSSSIGLKVLMKSLNVVGVVSDKLRNRNS